MKKETMAKRSNYNVMFGDLVAAVFDSAAQFSTDPKEVSRIALKIVEHTLQHAQRTLAAVPLMPCAKTTTLLQLEYAK